MLRAGSEEVRALQRSSAALKAEMPITTRARPHEPARIWGTVAKERRIRAPLRCPARNSGYSWPPNREENQVDEDREIADVRAE